MGLIDGIARVGEALPWPDPLLRRAIGLLVARTDRQLRTASPEATRLFAEKAGFVPVATHTAAANEQHYELPERFFGLVLGPHRKYSCCIFPTAAATLAEAEEHALAQTAENAALEDGQTILELGCGWGSVISVDGRTLSPRPNYVSVQFRIRSAPMSSTRRRAAA